MLSLGEGDVHIFHILHTNLFCFFTAMDFRMASMCSKPNLRTTERGQHEKINFGLGNLIYNMSLAFLAFTSMADCTDSALINSRH